MGSMLVQTGAVWQRCRPAFEWALTQDLAAMVGCANKPSGISTGGHLATRVPHMRRRGERPETATWTATAEESEAALET